jgi:hypothetical protein
MTMPPEMKLQWIEAASLVVQVAIERVDAPDIRLGELAECTVTGKVRRVFVGNYECDALLSFRMAVYCEKPPPGDCYQDVEKLRDANFIEAYLEKDADEPGVWSARDTLLIEEVGNEQILLTWLRQAVGQYNSEEKASVSNLTKLWRRLQGRA